MTAPRDIPVWADLVARNPYRVLGLSGDSSWPDIQERAAALRSRPDPETHSTAWDIPWFAPLPRSPADVERAVARLADPIQRIRDRLFWFHEGVSEMAVLELLPVNLRNALEGWSATSAPLARHDAAVVALLKALALDSGVEDAATWRRLFHEWDSAVALEDYWMAVLRLELGGGFETPASLADVREVRESAERAIAAPLIEIARAAVLAENLATAARALAVLREALPADAFSRSCGDLASHVWGRFDADWTTSATRPPPAGAAAPPDGIALETQNPALWDLSTADEPARAAGRPAAAPAGGPGVPAGGTKRRAADAPVTGPVEPPAGATGAAPAARGEPAAPDPPAAEPGGPPEREESRVAAATPPAPSPGPRAADEGETDEPAPAEREAPPDEADELPGRAAPARRGRPRPRPLWIGGIAASIAVAVALAALATDDPPPAPEPADPVTLTVLEDRLEQSDGEIARAMVERHEVEQELDLVARAVDGYRVLVEDYERRASYRLSVDRNAWSRVARTHDRFVVRRDSLQSELEGRVAVQDSLERVDQSLVAAYNLLRSESRSRDPSPR